MLYVYFEECMILLYSSRNHHYFTYLSEWEMLTQTKDKGRGGWVMVKDSDNTPTTLATRSSTRRLLRVRFVTRRVGANLVLFLFLFFLLFVQLHAIFFFTYLFYLMTRRSRDTLF